MSLRLAPAEIFDSEAQCAHRPAHAIRSSTVMMGAQAMMFVLQLLGTVVLARLLTPDDYGLIAMTAVVFGLAKVFRDAGLGSATVQSAEVTPERVSTIFWFNLFVITVIFALIAGTAPLVSAFFGRSEMTLIIVVMGAAFFVNGLSIQHDALLKRRTKFVSIAVENVVAQALNVAGSIGLALAGAGYWAIVAGPCISAVVTTSLSLWMCPWLPGRPRRGTGARVMVRFGVDVTGFNLVNYLSRNLDNILIGRVLGASQLGVYSKAYTLFTQPLQQIRGPLAEVALPNLSRLQNDAEGFRTYYARFVEGLAMLTVPIGAICALESEFIVRLVLGPSWMGVASVLRILALVGVIQAVESTRGIVLLSQGKSRRHLIWGAANSVILAIAFVIGLQWGVVGVAAAYAVASYLVLVPNLIFCFKGTPVTLATFAGATVPYVLFASVAAAAGYLAGRLMDGSWWASGVASVTAFTLGYIALCATLRESRRHIAAVVHALAGKRGRSQEATSVE